MYKHHEDTIKNITEKLKKRDDILGLVIGGSIAHGFATEVSDVDIMIIVTQAAYEERLKTGDIHYWENECCTYKDGYIDGKYITIDFMEKVADRGSEPARFAFEGSIIAFSKIDGLQKLINNITKYPKEKQRENIRRFFAQLEAWKWYYYEALKHKNEYLLNLSVSNIILFGGRLILAHNQLLYPYHKWFLRVLDCAECKPERTLELIEEILKNKGKDSIEAFYEGIRNMTDWEIADLDWPAQFMIDNELNWFNSVTPVADV